MVVAGEASEQADALGSGSLGKGDADLPGWIPEVDSSDSDDEWRTLWVLDAGPADPQGSLESTRAARTAVRTSS